MGEGVAVICSGCEDNFHDRCLDGQMHSSEKPWAIECDCASKEHDYKKRKEEPECNCMIPYLEGAGQHSPKCAIFKTT